MTPSSTSARRAGHCTRILASLALLLSLAAPARAQVVGGGGVVPGGGGIAGGGSIAGPLLLPDGTAALPSLAFTSEPSSGLYRAGSNDVRLQIGGNRLWQATATYFGINDVPLTLQAAGVNRVFLYSDALNSLGLRNGTNPQTLSVYNTYTDGSNNEQGFLRWSSNELQLGMLGNGTGANRNLTFFTGGGRRWQMTTGGDLVALTDNTLDIGASGATRPRSIYAGTLITSAGFALSAGTSLITTAAGSQTIDMHTSGLIGLTSTNVYISQANNYQWQGRSVLNSPADGVFQAINNGGTGFTRFVMGTNDATTNGASWNMNAGVLEAKTGDASAFSGIKVGAFTGAGGNLVLSTPGGKFTTYSGVTTAGVGVPIIVASANISAQTSNATITSFTAAAADSDFNVSAQMSVTASTTLATTLTCTYTDVANVARTMVMPVQPLSGTFTAAGAITGAGASIWETPVMHIRVKASTTITLLTSAGTFTSVTYSASGVIRQLN